MEDVNQFEAENEFRNQGEEYFRREFHDLLKELDCDEKEMLSVKSTVIKKYIEMRHLGFSEYITLSEIENLSTNIKVNEINEIKRQYVDKLGIELEKNIQFSVQKAIKHEVEKFEKIYGPEWMYIASNESELIGSLLKTLEEGIKQEECMEMINDSDSNYKKEYYQATVDSIKISRKDAELYFHVLMEILRINKNISHAANSLKNAKGFFSKNFDEKMSFLSSVVEKVNRIKHLERLMDDKSISIVDKEVIRNFFIEQKNALSEFLISSKDVEDSSFFQEFILNESSGKLVPSLEKSLNTHRERWLTRAFAVVKNNFRVLSQPFYELAFEVKKLYKSNASVGEKWFRLSLVSSAFLGLFAGLISFVFFSPQGSLFYEDPILKVPVVLAFYWASAKISRELLYFSESLYCAYERLVYGIEGHVNYILTNQAKSYFREIELQEMRSYFMKEISACQRRLRSIKDKESDEFNIELNVIKQLGLAWEIIQNGGIEQDRIKTVKAVQLCVREIYKIRSNIYENQFWRYDDSNTYNMLGVFMQNVKHAETMKLAIIKKDENHSPSK